MKLALSGNRVVGYGENLVPMGGTVVDTDTNKVYQNATVAECDGCPSDIDKVGYEYHAGMFVPCAPYADEESNGHVMVACDTCATPRRSDKKIQDVMTYPEIFTGTLAKNQNTTLALSKPAKFVLCSVSEADNSAIQSGILVPDDTASPPPMLQFFETSNSLGLYYLQVYFDVTGSDKIIINNQVNPKKYTILAFS